MNFHFLLVLVAALACVCAVFEKSENDTERISSSTLRLRNRWFGKRRHRTICSPDNDENNAKKLREVVKVSDFVFTGTVVGVPSKKPRNARKVRLRKRKKKTDRQEATNSIPLLQPPESALPKPQVFLVEIKRVIKASPSAALESNARITLRVPAEFVSGVQLTSDPLLNTNCVEFHPVLKILQTTILLAWRANQSDVFELTSFPLAMTLRHLERVDAAVKAAVLVEHEDSIEINGITFNKPFVEKPVDAEDHNIYIYYPSSTGGGSQRLFRKIGSRSSMYSSESRVRKKGSFIYEDFMPTDGTDVKVYTVGPDYAHAEARKSPALDGKVERDCEGKEVRFPVILNKQEKLISRQVCTTFKQHVCGFDLLRAGDKSCVCDVNGFSFVKSSTKYYEDCSKILGNTILRELAPKLNIAWSIPYQLDDPLIVPTTFGKMMELRCVIAVIRHGDRTPKQKMKVEVRHPKFFAVFDKYDGHKKGHVKLKSPQQLQEILDIARTLLNDIDEGGANSEMKIKLEQLKTVLEMYGHFSGINRKVQMKYQPTGRPRGSSSEEELPHEPSLVLILKWGGELTPAGRSQAEELGRLFRCIYPGGEDSGPRGLGLGLLRLHSTFRHDLKIYASEEGRVQMTAAAFTKGFLALEGELTPILAQMVKSANTNGLLDNDSDASKYQNAAKQRLHELMSLNRPLTETDRAALNPCNAITINRAIDFVNNPVECCTKLHLLIQEFLALLKEKIEGGNSHSLYYGESWELMLRRWSKIDKDFGVKDGKFDISKIPDIYDCIKFDMQHNQKLIQYPRAEQLYTMAKFLADIVVPQEYGLTSDEKLAIGRGICTPLMKKICSDLERNLNESDEEPVNRLNPRYSSGVASPGRHVKTRLYFTSESHLHGLVSCLCRGGLLQDSDEQSRRALEYVSSVSELNFMSKIVIMLYEDPTKDATSDERFHIELHFSPGVNCCVQKNLPPGPGFRSTRSSRSSHTFEFSYLPCDMHASQAYSSLSLCHRFLPESLKDDLFLSGRLQKVSLCPDYDSGESHTTPNKSNVWNSWWSSAVAAAAAAITAASIPLTLTVPTDEPDGRHPLALHNLTRTRSSDNADFAYDAMTKSYRWMPTKQPWEEDVAPMDLLSTRHRATFSIRWDRMDWTYVSHFDVDSLCMADECSSEMEEEYFSCSSESAEPQRQRQRQRRSRQRGVARVARLSPCSQGPQGQCLISTAVISGASAAAPLLPTSHHSGSGFGTVPPIRPLETLHNALSLRQLIEFLRTLTGPLPMPIGTPPRLSYYYGEGWSSSSLGSPCPSPSYVSGENSSYSRDDSFFMRDNLEKAAASALINIHALIDKEKKDLGEKNADLALDANADGLATPVQEGHENCDMGSLSSLPLELLAPEMEQEQRTITVISEPARDSIIGFFHQHPA